MQKRFSRRKFNATLLGAALTSIWAVRASSRTPDKDVLPFLRGVNFSGLTHEVGSQPPSKHAVGYYITQKAMNVVRLNFSWEFIQPELSRPLQAGNVSLVQEQVDRIGSAGAYTILEFHNYGRRSVDGKEYIIGESSRVTVAQYADAWGRMAATWGANRRVIFSLMNEPHDVDPATLVTATNAAISAIRKAGSPNLIMVAGHGWNSMDWSASSPNQRVMLDINDPLDHYCFDVHHYFDDWSRGQGPSVRDDPLASMYAFTKWAKANRKKGFCGEFGCGVNQLGIDACRQLLQHIEGNRDVFLGWTWWGGGGSWQPDYVFLLDPFASETSATNPDPQGTLTWKDPVDRPQMKLLQEFLPKSATPFNGWLIEDQLGSVTEAIYRRGDYRSAGGAWWRGRRQGARWFDSGPKRLEAVPNGPAPSVQSDGSVRFDHDGQVLVSSASNGGPMASVYAVVELQGASPAPRSVLGATSRSPRRSVRLAIEPDGAIALRIGDAVPRLSPASDSASKSKTLVQAAYAFTDGAGNVRTVLGTGGRTAPPVSSRTQNLDQGRSVLGARDDRGTEGLKGTIHELVIFTKPLAGQDNARVQGRLHWDNGMAHLLPSDHPYRTKAPRVDGVALH